MIIRKIQPNDNVSVEKLIKETLLEFGLPTTGTAYEDKETTNMFMAYQNEREVYFVLEIDGIVLGGGGIKQLGGADKSICELQKMYFSPTIRAKGYGQIFFEYCMQMALELGYKKCYLESASIMKSAIHIYKKNGFKHLDGPFGDTGHYSCGVWMMKDL